MPIFTREEAEEILLMADNWLDVIIHGELNDVLEDKERQIRVGRIMGKTQAAINSANKHAAMYDDSVEVPF